MVCKTCESKPVIKLSNNERALCKSCFFKYFEKKVRWTISKHKLFSKRDKLAVAVSGGKDSTVTLYVLNKLGYNLEGITIDAVIGNYTKTNLENLRKVCKKYKIKLNVISFRDEFGMSLCFMRSLLKSKGYDYSSCMLCGILKRYLLNKYAREGKFDCLVTGHNLDDEAQAFLMNLFRNDFKLARRQGPITGMTISSRFVKRVKPLYYLPEKEVEMYSKLMDFPVNYEICPCSVNAYRRKHGNFLNEYEKEHPSVKHNIIKFLESIKENLKSSKNVKVGICESCGEAASDTKCRVCKVIEELRKIKE